MLGERAFLLKVIPYPHEVVRSHKMMGFAGADRVSQGMKLSFGKATARAARISKDQAILSVFVEFDDVKVAKKALERASKKLPIKYNFTIEDVEEDIEDPTGNTNQMTTVRR
jgi:large subunit ribosomal protein L10e